MEKKCWENPIGRAIGGSLVALLLVLGASGRAIGQQAWVLDQAAEDIQALKAEIFALLENEENAVFVARELVDRVREVNRPDVPYFALPSVLPLYLLTLDVTDLGGSPEALSVSEELLTAVVSESGEGSVDHVRAVLGLSTRQVIAELLGDAFQTLAELEHLSRELGPGLAELVAPAEYFRGLVAAALGDSETSIRALRRARALFDKQPPGRQPVLSATPVLSASATLVLSRKIMVQEWEAERLFESSNKVRRTQGPDSVVPLAETLLVLAANPLTRGVFAEAYDYVSEAKSILDAHPEASAELRGEVLRVHGAVSIVVGQPRDAIPSLEEASMLIDVDSPDYISAQAALLVAYANSGAHDEANRLATLLSRAPRFLWTVFCEKENELCPKENRTRLGPRREPGGRPERPQPRRRSSARGGGLRAGRCPWSSSSSRGNRSRASVAATG